MHGRAAALGAGVAALGVLGLVWCNQTGKPVVSPAAALHLAGQVSCQTTAGLRLEGPLFAAIGGGGEDPNLTVTFESLGERHWRGRVAAAPRFDRHIPERISEVFEVELSPTCRVERVLLARGASGSSRATVASIVGALDFELKDADVWTSIHTDASGEFAASHRRGSDGTVVRRKVLYRVNSGSPPRVSGESRFQPGFGWLRAVHIRETYQAAGMTVPFELDLTLEQASGAPLPSVDGGEWLALDTLRTTASTPVVAEAPRQRVNWEAFLSGDLERAREQAVVIGELARTDKNVFAELVASRRRLHPNLRAPHYLALRVVGTPEAQAALLEAATDVETSPSDHSNALAVFHDLDAPSRRTLDELERLATTHPEDEVRSGCILALGSLASRSEDAGRAVERMLLVTSDDAGEAPALIEALGNWGATKHFGRILRATESRVENVREAAVHAMRNYPDRRSLQQLLTLLRKDDSRFVLEAAAARAAEWLEREGCGDSDSILTAAEARLAHADSPELEAGLIRLLGACTEVPGAHRALLKHLMTTKSPVIRRTVGKYVSAEEAARALDDTP